MNNFQAAIFVFDSRDPTVVRVYPDLEWARESLESFDVGGDGDEPAFTATRQIVRVEPTADLFASFEVAGQVDLERLKALLRRVEGPAHLAGNAFAYAQEWTRLEILDAERPPFVPGRIWSWYRSKIRKQSSGSILKTL